MFFTRFFKKYHYTLIGEKKSKHKVLTFIFMKKSFVIIYYENFCGKKRKKYILSNLLKMCLEGHATADTSIYDLPFKQLILSIK